MTAPVILLPVITRHTFHDPAWREQYERECAALCDAQISAPRRTRPILVVSNRPRMDGSVTRDNFEAVMAQLCDVLRDNQGRD